MSEDQERDLDERHMALRAAVMKLRAYAYELSIRPKATIRAEEMRSRLDEALYPKDADRRREPLDRLLEVARKDAAKTYREPLESALRRVRKLATDMRGARGGVRGDDHAALAKRAEGIADDLAAFLNECGAEEEAPPPPPAE